MFDPRKHHRRSVRAAYHDYSAAGAYFVTICAVRHRPIFGRIENGVMQLNWVGEIVAAQWNQSGELRAEIELDEWIIMPNHFHAIVWITNVGAHGNAPETLQSPTTSRSRNKRAHCHAPLRAPRSLSSLVSGFKGSVTRAVNAERENRGLSPVVVWQRSFHERIMRDENELETRRRYIIENPLHWERDEYRLE